MSTRKQPPFDPFTLKPGEALCSEEEWAEILAEQRRKEIEEGKKYRTSKDGKPVMVVHSPVDL